MSFIVRRLLLTMLVPFAWKQWRNRNRPADGSPSNAIQQTR
ncbi:MAG: hypothetical protein ACSLFP_09915 [Acidimicrobiales bacterium]